MSDRRAYVMQHQVIRRFHLMSWTWWPFIVLVAVAGGCRVRSDVNAPGQPAFGPGGSDYSHSKVTVSRFGEGCDEYWVLQPDDPQPAEAPLVVFLHGWGATNPQVYGAWLRHVVRKGHIVVYPRYQVNLLSSFNDMPGNALRAVQAAWERLNDSGPVRPAQDRLAWVGHSLGGLLATNLAASHVDSGLPPPAMIMLVQPGGLNTLDLAPLDAVPSDTLALIVVGDADRLVSRSAVIPFVDAFGHLPSSNVDLVTIRSDDHASEPLVADHLSPLSFDPSFPPGAGERSDADDGLSIGAPDGSFQVQGQLLQVAQSPPDALDYFGYWKLLDGLLDAAFRNRNRDYALGNTQEQRYMGRHSDGVPVTPLAIEIQP